MSSRADTLAHRRRMALAFIRSRDGWVEAKEVCEFLGVDRFKVRRALEVDVGNGTLERLHTHGGAGGSRLAWRIAVEKPAPAFTFSYDWPPGFVPRFDSVKLPAYEARLK